MHLAGEDHWCRFESISRNGLGYIDKSYRFQLRSHQGGASDAEQDGASWHANRHAQSLRRPTGRYGQDGLTRPTQPKFSNDLPRQGRPAPQNTLVKEHFVIVDYLGPYTSSQVHSPCPRACICLQSCIVDVAGRVLALEQPQAYCVIGSKFQQTGPTCYSDEERHAAFSANLEAFAFRHQHVHSFVKCHAWAMRRFSVDYAVTCWIGHALQDTLKALLDPSILHLDWQEPGGLQFEADSRLPLGFCNHEPWHWWEVGKKLWHAMEQKNSDVSQSGPAQPI